MVSVKRVYCTIALAALAVAAPAESQTPTSDAVLAKQLRAAVRPAADFRQVTFLVHRQPVRRVLLRHSPQDFQSTLWIAHKSPVCEYQRGTINVFYCYGAGVVTRIVAVPQRPVVISASSMATRPVRVTIRY